MKIALMFSGQGSQYPNMGIDLISSKEASTYIKEAESILEFNVIDALTNKNSELNETLYVQPLMVLYEILLFKKIKNVLNVEGLIGFSLGEISALYAAGIYDFNSIIKIVKKRAEAMNSAALTSPGKMLAVIDCEMEIINSVCQEVSKTNVLVVANYNSKKQVVLSGDDEGISKGQNLLKSLGARKVIQLNVSGAFHSPLMKSAEIELFSFLENFKKGSIKIPFYMNATSQRLNLDDLEKLIAKQLTSPVYFYQSIEQMIKDGFDTFIEVGPGNVLSKLVSKNYSNIKTYCVGNEEDLRKLKEEILDVK
ncbi:MAG: ACP S-malonyltransferase [Acholeplasma sp.]|nr:ACP S-malonyltransferase [Acholeplasma sp.]